MIYRERRCPDPSQAMEIIAKAVDGQRLSLEELEILLDLKDPKLIDEMFLAARSVKEEHFGDSIFCYGFVYFSTYCQNDCSFCFYRRSNDHSVRYRKSMEEIVSLAAALEDSGVHLVDLTMGEDPAIHRKGDVSGLIELVRSVDDAVDVPLMISPGVIPQNAFRDLREAGGDWFACYQETHNRKLFERLRPGQDYDLRLTQKKWAMGTGMLAEDGIMIGVGETAADRAHSIMTMGELGVRQVRAMGFVPQLNTPMSRWNHAPFLEELITIAVMRLTYPDRLIPASLDVEGIGGLKSRLEAGANVVTSIIPPQKGLAGVAQHELDIEAGGRTVSQIEEVLDDLGVHLATPMAYSALIEEWRSADRGARA